MYLTRTENPCYSTFQILNVASNKAECLLDACSLYKREGSINFPNTLLLKSMSYIDPLLC